MVAIKPPWLTRLGGVAAEHPMAVKVGLDILNIGGNAFDAAVAISLALSVTQPHLGGLGSDLVALLYIEGKGEIKFLNATGWAPRRLTKEVLAERGLSSIPRRGALSIVVPGMLAGLYEINKTLGTMEWSRLVRHVAGQLNTGFPAGVSLVKALNEASSSGLVDDAFKSTYLLGIKPWDVVKLPKLIRTLELVAEHGIDIFYRGEIGQAIVDHVKSLGGVLELDDLREYMPEWGKPIQTEYGGYIVFETPPNTQGVTTLMILRLIEDFKASSALSAERIKHYVNAYRVAYSARDMYVGDPRFVDVPIDKLLSKEFLMNNVNVMDRLIGLSAGDTTYFVVVDGEGNVASCIQSLYYHFGSMVTEPKYGITLNNRASDFSTMGPNALGPRKRPLHTLSTLMAFRDNELRVALGTSGAHYRPQQHVLMFTNMVDYGMGPVDAVNAPRFLWSGKGIVAEEGVNVDALDIEYRIIDYPGGTGVASILAFLDNGYRLLYSDIRGDGLAVGQ